MSDSARRMLFLSCCRRYRQSRGPHRISPSLGRLLHRATSPSSCKVRVNRVCLSLRVEWATTYTIGPV